MDFYDRFAVGEYVLIASCNMQAPVDVSVQMNNRKGRKQERRLAKDVKKAIRYFKDREIEAAAVERRKHPS
jgi:hypothetical protein